MKRKTTICFLFFLTITMCYAQKPDIPQIYGLPNNSIYIELAGTEILYSLNYERNIINLNRFYLSARLGASYWAIIYYKNVRFPLMFNVIYRCYKGFCVEIGSGASLIKNYSVNGSKGKSRSYVHFNSVSNVGIRYQGQYGFVFRAGFVPIYMFDGYESGFVPFAGISLGYSFGNKK